MTRTLAALALIALLGTGCSDAASESADSGSGGTKPTGRDKTVKFAQCMRDNGVTEFPDENPNASSDQEFVDAIQRARERSAAAWKSALRACKDLRPPGLLGGKATTEEMRERLAFARCMRENGIEDFPDPTRDGPVIDTRRIPSAAGRGALDIPGFTAATEACRDALGRTLGDR
jgi:hypothetical protein